MTKTSGNKRVPNKPTFEQREGLVSLPSQLRHPLLDTEKAVSDEADALYMLGACASFVSYLIAKTKQDD